MTQSRPFFHPQTLGLVTYISPLFKGSLITITIPKRSRFRRIARKFWFKKQNKKREKKKTRERTLFGFKLTTVGSRRLVDAIHLERMNRESTEEYIKPLDLFEVHPSEAWWKSTRKEAAKRDPPFWRGFLNLYCRDVFGSSKRRYVLEGSVFLGE